MELTVSLAFWMVPAFVTVLSALAWFLVDLTEPSRSNSLGLNKLWSPLALLICLTISLTAWASYGIFLFLKFFR